MACDPQTLARNASCYFCLPPGMIYPVKLAILARWLKSLSPGANTSVAALMADANCFACPPNAQLGPMKLALVCDATSGSVPPVPPPAPSDLTIDLFSVAANVTPTWTNNGGATSIEIWKSVNGGAYALYDTAAGAATSYNDLAGIPALDYWEYEVRAVNAGGNSAFSNKAAVANGITDHASAAISYPFLILSLADIALDNNAALLSASFPKLRQVNGNFTLNQCDFLAVTDFSALQLVTGNFTFADDTTSLVSISFPSLTDVGGNFSFSACFSLTSITANLLNTVGSDLIFSDCTVLAALSFPALTLVGSDFLGPNSGVVTLSAPNLIQLADLNFNNCGALTTIDFSSLQNSNGSLEFNNAISLVSPNLSSLTVVTTSLFFNNCSAMTSFSVPSLVSVGGIFDLNGATTLNTLTITNLATVGIGIDLQGTALTTFSAPALTTIGGGLVLSGLALNVLSLPVLANMGTLSADGLIGTLANFSLPSLLHVTTSDMGFNNSASLTSISAPALIDVSGDIRLDGCSGLVSFSVASLTQANAIISAGNTNLTTVDFTSLVQIVADFDFSNCTSLTALSIPTAGFTITGTFNASGCTSLATVSIGSGATFSGQFTLTGDSSLVSLSVSNATFAAFLTADSCGSLTTVTLGTTTFLDNGQTITFDSDALNQASVDGILHRGVVSGVTTLDFELANGTNATPSATGLADKATLILAGNIVNTN
jgi:hypothetical protein